MAWESYKLVFRIKTPLHIGAGTNMGVIDQTRHYVPGKTIWGAVTAKIGKQFGLKKFKAWNKLGEFIRENMIFTYMFLQDDEIFSPNYSENGFGYGMKDNQFFISKEEFERRYITSFVSTAIEENKSAEEGSLHEIELISNRNKENGNKLKLIGYVFINPKGASQEYSIEENTKLSDGNKNIDLFESIEDLQIGGERNYGFGKLEIESPKIIEDTNDLFGICQIDKETLEINSDNKEIIMPGHKQKGNCKAIRGITEPFVAREIRSDQNQGRHQENHGVVYVPGSLMAKNNAKIVLDKHGIFTERSQK